MLKLCVLLSILFLMIVDHTVSHLTSGPHIADVNILLPPKMTNPVEYRLQGSDGCFKWYARSETLNYKNHIITCFELMESTIIIKFYAA